MQAIELEQLTRASAQAILAQLPGSYSDGVCGTGNTVKLSDRGCIGDGIGGIFG